MHVQDIPSSKWDILLLLDACRYDVFRHVNRIPGRLDKRWSKGSVTEIWWRMNFYYPQKDIVYLSGHPSLRSDNQWAKIFPVILDVWDYGWNEELTTTDPAVMAEETIKAVEKYPGMRILAHFLQPHAPYIGNPSIKGIQMHPRRARVPFDWNIGKGFFEGQITVEELKKAYISNLLVALKYCQKIVEACPDKDIVITSDHGELFGEYGLFFHSPVDRLWPFPEVRVVPWFRARRSRA